MGPKEFGDDANQNHVTNPYPNGEIMPLMRLFNRTGTLMHRYLRTRLRSHMHDPNRGQGRVLSILRLKPEISQKDLAYLLDMRGQSLGELLMKLERAGYITRASSEDDRRAMNINLTEAGKAAAEQTEKNQAESVRLFDCLTADEQARLTEILKKLIAAMEGEIGAECEEPWEDARRCRHEMHQRGREFRDEMREHSHEMREHAHRLRDHIRGELRDQMRDLRKELYRDGMPWDVWKDWSSPDGYDGYTDENHWDEEGRGNGPRK